MDAWKKILEALVCHSELDKVDINAEQKKLYNICKELELQIANEQVHVEENAAVSYAIAAESQYSIR